MPSWLDRSQRAVLALTALLYSAGYATVGLFAVLLTVVLEGFASRRLPWRRTQIDLLVAAFIGLFLFSGYLSEYRPMAVGSVGLAALTIYVGLGVLSRVLHRHPGFLAPLLWAWLAGGALAGGWAIAFHFQTRAAAATPALGQNAVGTTMMVATLIGLGLFLSVASRWRYVAVGMSAVTAAALTFSITRGAWLGAIAGVALLIGLGGRRVAGQVLIAIAAVAAVGALLAGPEVGSLVKRARSIPRVSDNASRVYLFRAAQAIAMDHPALGTGMNTFPMVYPAYRLPGDPNPPELQPFAHNIFINMAAEGGFLTLAVFLAILVQTLRLGWRWRSRAATESELARRTALLATFAGMLIHQLFDGTLISVHLGAGMWMIMATLISGGAGSGSLEQA